MIYKPTPIGERFLTTLAKQIACFLSCATIATLTDGIAYYLLLTILPYSAAKGCSFILCATVAFQLNKRFTFAEKKVDKDTIGRFSLLYSSTFFVNVGVNKLALMMMPRFTLVCFASAAAMTMLCNFLGQKFFVFRTPYAIDHHSLLQRSR